MERDDLGFVVVATDRIEALSKVLGPLEIVGQVQGGIFARRVCKVSLKKHLGSDLVGTPYRSIFSSSAHTFKVIPAIHVTAESGTGLVHCAPAHGAEDYNALRSLGLLSSHEMLCHVDAKGEFRADVVDVVGEDVASQLVGKSVLDEGNKAMVLLLKDLGKVLSTQRLKHRYPYDWKTDKPIIVTYGYFFRLEAACLPKFKRYLSVVCQLGENQGRGTFCTTRCLFFPVSLYVFGTFSNSSANSCL